MEKLKGVNEELERQLVNCWNERADLTRKLDEAVEAVKELGIAYWRGAVDAALRECTEIERVLHVERVPRRERLEQFEDLVNRIELLEIKMKALTDEPAETEEEA